MFFHEVDVIRADREEMENRVCAFAIALYHVPELRASVWVCVHVRNTH